MASGKGSRPSKRAKGGKTTPAPAPAGGVTLPETATFLDVTRSFDAIDRAIQVYEAEALYHNQLGRQLDRINEQMPDEREAALKRIIDRDQCSVTAADKKLGTDERYKMLRDERARLQAEREGSDYRKLAAQRRVDFALIRSQATMTAYEVQDAAYRTAIGRSAYSESLAPRIDVQPAPAPEPGPAEDFPAALAAEDDTPEFPELPSRDPAAAREVQRAAGGDDDRFPDNPF